MEDEYTNNPLYISLRDNVMHQLSKFRSEEYLGLRLDGQSASDVREIIRDIQYDVLNDVGEYLDEIYFPEL